MEFPLSYVRGCFPAIEKGGSVNFDSASSPSSLASVQSVRDNGNGASLHSLEDTRRSLAYFLNSNDRWADEEIRFAEDSDSLLARLASALAPTFEPGSEIIVTELDDESDLAPWMALADRDIRIKVWPVEWPEASLDPLRLDSLLTERTRLVIVPKASNVVGTIVELLPIALRVREHPASLLINWTPFLAHGALDVRFLRCDFLVASTAPLFGSRLGFLWGRKDRMREIGPTVFDERDVEPTEVASLGFALQYIEELGLLSQDMQLQPSEDYARRRHMRRGMQAIRHYERELTNLALRSLADVEGLSLFGVKSPDRSAQRLPSFLFRHEKMNPAELAKELEEHNVRVGYGSCGSPRLVEALGLSKHTGGVRASLAHYNSDEEIMRFTRALHDIAHRAS
jgi:selenocysteine lyase/cysteine desulfurase